MSADEEMIYGCTTELLRTKRVSDFDLQPSESTFRHQELVDLTAIAGRHTFLAMKLNAAQ